jgi:hypothetical protein
MGRKYGKLWSFPGILAKYPETKVTPASHGKERDWGRGDLIQMAVKIRKTLEFSAI